MKTKSIIAIICLGVGTILAVLGMINYYQVSKAIEEYASSPLAKPGSSSPYPAYDEALLYLDVSGIFFVTSGILFIIKRKGK
ncbi:MAG: hypothetical protein K8Q89_00275 [Nitrosarchaeum sp.]|nr:hypothetical protein [Nitrosarchaeum sp.]